MCGKSHSRLLAVYQDVLQKGWLPASMRPAVVTSPNLGAETHNIESTDQFQQFWSSLVCPPFIFVKKKVLMLQHAVAWYWFIKCLLSISTFGLAIISTYICQSIFEWFLVS